MLEGQSKSVCQGQVRHHVCVFSLADLSYILKFQGVVVNKVMTEYDDDIDDDEDDEGDG